MYDKSGANWIFLYCCPPHLGLVGYNEPNYYGVAAQAADLLLSLTANTIGSVPWLMSCVHFQQKDNMQNDSIVGSQPFQILKFHN